MKQSAMYIPTLRDIPSGAEINSHKILLKGGYVKQHAAGVYSYLPLAYKIVKKIENIIREELNQIGATEFLMPALQAKDLWLESGRWKEYGKELMRLTDRHDREFCLGPTHEEVSIAAVRDAVSSYKKLPLALYQIQIKFRDEYRPRFGLMRAREFIMKDLYTFSATPEDLDCWYLKVRGAYQKIFARCGLDFRIVDAATGTIGGSASEEFMALCDIGEEEIVYAEGGTFARNTELGDLPDGSPAPGGGIIRHAKGIELGHIFKLGTRYSVPMHFNFIDADNIKKPVVMGCYGIGVSRLLMAILEQHSTGLKALWPDSVAPFGIHILSLAGNKQANDAAEKIYRELSIKGFDVLLDDREESLGVKFKDADLIGIRYVIVCGKKLNDGMVEIIDNKTKKQELINYEDAINYPFFGS